MTDNDLISISRHFAFERKEQRNEEISRSFATCHLLVRNKLISQRR
jgi:hypothetical protein